MAFWNLFNGTTKNEEVLNLRVGLGAVLTASPI